MMARRSFFDLPLEIRDIVYAEVLQPKRCGEYEIVQVMNRPSLSSRSSTPTEFYDCTNVLLLCRQSYDKYQRFLQQIPRSIYFDCDWLSMLKFTPRGRQELSLDELRSVVDARFEYALNAKHLILHVCIVVSFHGPPSALVPKLSVAHRFARKMFSKISKIAYSD